MGQIKKTEESGYTFIPKCCRDTQKSFFQDDSKLAHHNIRESDFASWNTSLDGLTSFVRTAYPMHIGKARFIKDNGNLSPKEKIGAMLESARKNLSKSPNR